MARVLIVEDNPAITMVMEMVLKDAGYEVAVAENGAKALVSMKDGFLPDIVVTDLVMEEMDGWSMVTEMRAGDKSKNIPVIVMTGSVSDPENLPEPSLFQGLLTKPFELEDLISMVQKLIEKELQKRRLTVGTFAG